MLFNLVMSHYKYFTQLRKRALLKCTRASGDSTDSVTSTPALTKKRPASERQLSANKQKNKTEKAIENAIDGFVPAMKVSDEEQPNFEDARQQKYNERMNKCIQL